jgi:hypothetical protein
MNMKAGNFFLTLTIALVAFALISCDDDPCNCLATYGTTAHLGIDETCDCGGKDCGCTEQTATLDGIAIRKQAGISIADMNTAVTNIGNVYNGPDMGISDRTKFKTKVTQIHIVSGNAVVLEGTVLKVGSGATEAEIYDYIADYVLVP